MPSVNDTTKYTTKQEAIEPLEKVLLRIIVEISEAQKNDGKSFFRKIDIKYGLWIMI